MSNEPAQKPLKIVFCLPGNSFSGTFIDRWTHCISYCFDNGIKPMISRKESNNIYFVRNLCLGGNTMLGKNQAPFNGKVDYDFIMWIDSDVIFSPEQIKTLISHDTDIASGVYVMQGGTHLATCKEWDEEFFSRHGGFDLMRLDEIEGKKELVEVAYTGFGFILIKKGVFESMEYPWFKPITMNIGKMTDFCGDDVSFCLTAREKGFKIYIDPTVRVGHEKKIIL